MAQSCYCTCQHLQSEFNPATFQPTLPESSHLEFMVEDTQPLETRFEHLYNLYQEYYLDSSMPDSICSWVEHQLEITQTQINQLKQIEHQNNAYLLAERVVHKFKKWGPVRFGVNPNCQRDFYDGTLPVNSNDNLVHFEPIFRHEVNQVAFQSGLSGEYILSHLHIGLESLHRFQDFMAVEITDYVSEFDSENDLSDSENDLSDSDSDLESDYEREHECQCSLCDLKSDSDLDSEFNVLDQTSTPTPVTTPSNTTQNVNVTLTTPVDVTEFDDMPELEDEVVVMTSSA